MQHWFSMAARILAGAALFFLCVGFAHRIGYYKVFRAPPSLTVELVPVRIADRLPAGWSVAGAWKFRSDHIYFSGLSGLLVTDGQLLAVSDAWHLARFDPPEPGDRILDVELTPLAQVGDTEAIERFEEGLWIAHERDHRLVRNEAGGEGVTVLLGQEMVANRGIEGLVTLERGLVALGEGQDAFLYDGEKVRGLELVGARAMPTGAAALDKNRFLLLSRDIGLGLTNYVALARLEDDRILVGPAQRLPLSRLDNAEGIAIRRRADGGHDLWIVTDDNRGPPQRTLLVHFMITPGGWPFETGP